MRDMLLPRLIRMLKERNLKEEHEAKMKELLETRTIINI